MRGRQGRGQEYKKAAALRTSPRRRLALLLWTCFFEVRAAMTRALGRGSDSTEGITRKVSGRGAYISH